MNASRYRPRAFLIAYCLIGMSFQAGCVHDKTHTLRSRIFQEPSNCEFLFSPPCFGYTSTCWHPWPAECPNCPAYALPGEVMERLPTPSVAPGDPDPNQPPPMTPGAEPAPRP